MAIEVMTDLGTLDSMKAQWPHSLVILATKYGVQLQLLASQMENGLDFLLVEKVKLI